MTVVEPLDARGCGQNLLGQRGGRVRRADKHQRSKMWRRVSSAGNSSSSAAAAPLLFSQQVQ